jgi:DNA-directed RNA polymerase subunit RPC12/RpoP
MNAQPDLPETVTVVCPTCGTRLDPRVTANARKVRCPDCFVAVAVPPLAEVLQQIERRRKPKLDDVGTYQFLSTDESEAKNREQQPAPYVKVICFVCSARLHPEVREKAYRIRCPDCHKPVDVPARRDVPDQPAAKQPPNPGVYKTAAAAVTEKPKLQTSYLEALAEIRREKIDPPPRWTFFSGVFLFPWSPGVLSRWAFLSVGFTVLGLLLSGVVALFSGASGNGGVAIAFLVLPAIWIMLWTFSYAAACCLPVLTDTAAGMDRIANWPEPVWNEWMARLFYVGFISVPAIALGYGVGASCALLLGDEYWFVWPVTSFLLCPIFLLSSLETTSPFVLLSLPILRSLISFWWGWLTFYGLSAASIVAWIALAVAGSESFPLLSVFVSGPLVAAVLFIVSRLLGRLAWRAVLLSSNEKGHSHA